MQEIPAQVGKAGEMNLNKLQPPHYMRNNKVHVEIRLHPEWDGKYWVHATLLKSREWVISLEELGLIIRAIGWCEDIKYKNGRGRFYTLDFLQDCLWNETTQDDLVKKYQIPIRGNGDGN